MSAGLAGQVAIVTGAGRGIGRAIAVQLAAEGAAVAVAARTARAVEETAAAIRGDGGSSIAVAMDVTDRADNEALLARAEAELGAVTLFVNSAGTLEGMGPIWEADPDVWWRDVEISLRGAMLGMRAVLPGMLARGAGRIVNVSSVAGLSANPGGSGYTAAKMAVIRLSESVAAQVEGRGVTVFAIDPGMVRTYLTEHLVTDPVGAAYYHYLPRMFDDVGLPAEEAAALVCFLATGEGDGLSGRFISVMDDYREVARRAAEVRARDLYQVRWNRLPDLAGEGPIFRRRERDEGKA